MNNQTMQLQGRPAKQLLTRNVAVAVGFARQSVPLKAERFAAVVGHSKSHESRIRSGDKLSATGRAAVAIYEAVKIEACPIEAAGYCAAIIEVTLRSIAMWPELEKLTTEELRAELKREVARRETRANGLCNDLDSAFLADEKMELAAMLDAHTQQATASTRIAAILQLLIQRNGK